MKYKQSAQDIDGCACVCRWSLQLPTDRQLNSSFWLPYAVVQQVVDALRVCGMQDVLKQLQARLSQHVQGAQRDSESLRAGHCLRA